MLVLFVQNDRCCLCKANPKKVASCDCTTWGVYTWLYGYMRTISYASANCTDMSYVLYRYCCVYVDIPRLEPSSLCVTCVRYVCMRVRYCTCCVHVYIVNIHLVNVNIITVHAANVYVVNARIVNVHVCTLSASFSLTTRTLCQHSRHQPTS